LGKIHLRLLHTMSDIQFMGFYDSDGENTQTLIDTYKTPHYNTEADLMNACDAVVIATPTKTHFEYVKRCLEADKHVFVEKPATAEVYEAASLMQVVAGKNLMVQVGMVERFNQAFRVVEPMFADKPLKKIFCNRLAPFTPRGADVSVVMDVMIHDIDIVLKLVKSEIKQITAFGQKLGSETFDLATAHIVFENGCTAHFTASRKAERKYRITEVFTEDKIYQIDFLHKKTSVFGLKEGFSGSLEEEYLNFPHSHVTEEKLLVEDTNAIGEELKSFVNSIVNNKKVVVSLDDGIRAMQLAGEIEQIMAHHR